MASANKDNFQK